MSSEVKTKRLTAPLNDSQFGWHAESPNELKIRDALCYFPNSFWALARRTHLTHLSRIEGLIMKIRRHSGIVSAALVLSVALAVIGSVQSIKAQTLGFQRDRSREMLEVIKRDLQKNYYDPSFHGVDIEAVFKEADELLKKADSHGQMYGIIARALLQLNDSHTYFVAPSRVARTDYG